MGHDRLSRQIRRPSSRSSRRYATVEPGKDVAIVRVTTWLRCAQSLDNNRHTYFIRVGTQSREPTQKRLGRLFQQVGRFGPNSGQFSGSTLADLDRRRLRDYFGRIGNRMCLTMRM